MADVSMGELLIRSVISLGVVLALVFGAYAILRRRMNGGRSAGRGRAAGAWRAVVGARSARRAPGGFRSIHRPATVRSNRPNRNGLRVVGRAAIGRSAMLTAVQFGERVLLVGASEQSAPMVLAELDGREWEQCTNPGRELAISTSALNASGAPGMNGTGFGDPMEAGRDGDADIDATDGLDRLDLDASGAPRLAMAPRGILDALREATTRRG
jgi:flagellar biogenesis protein FliO